MADNNTLSLTLVFFAMLCLGSLCESRHVWLLVAEPEVNRPQRYPLSFAKRDAGLVPNQVAAIIVPDGAFDGDGDDYIGTNSADDVGKLMQAFGFTRRSRSAVRPDFVRLG